jgi:wyosine [tRNA(Phe)-imidazoG37] synthetase (radical SAM superfamily)
VDLTPHKTCCLDCIFCQLGPTTNKTIGRREYVPTNAVLAEIENWLAAGGQADHITLSGCGEPTLHTDFGQVLEFIRNNTDIPSVLLTNGTLLYLPEVCEAAACADIVKVSLSVWNQASFEWINRPLPPLQFDRMMKGQKTFRNQFKGQLWMEVFLISGFNAMPEDVKKIASLANSIFPDLIQINTAVRPPSEDFVVAVSREKMASLRHLFQPEAEILAEFSTSHHTHSEANEEAICAMLKRRPCTAQQIADGFDMHLNEVLKYLNMLQKTDQIHTKRILDSIYYASLR